MTKWHQESWRDLAEKYSEVRVFIEFTNAHPEQFSKWILKELGIEGGIK